MTVTDEDVYAYLEHHGVKGMRWGARKHLALKPGQQAAKQRIREEDFRKNRRKERIVTGLAVGAIGIMVANQILSSNRKKQLREISKQATRQSLNNASKAGQLFGAYKKTPMSQVVRTGFAVDTAGSAAPLFKRVVGR
jgi:hypothetical protein